MKAKIPAQLLSPRADSPCHNLSSRMYLYHVFAVPFFEAVEVYKNDVTHKNMLDVVLTRYKTVIT